MITKFNCHLLLSCGHLLGVLTFEMTKHDDFDDCDDNDGIS